MPRSRNIKPSFFTNDELAELSVETRLLFIGLWTLADRDGLLEYRPKKIKAQLFPYDSVPLKKLLEDLRNARFISFYEVEGKQFIEIVNFSKHQNPHKNEKESGLPKPNKNNTLSINREKDGTSTEKIGTARADSLLLIPDSCNLIPEDIPSNEGIGAQTSSDPPESFPQCPHKAILALWKEILPCRIQPRVWDETRQKHLRARWKQFPDLKDWRQFFESFHESDFLMGRKNTPGRAPFELSLDWVVKAENFNKILEGKYHGNAASTTH